MSGLPPDPFTGIDVSGAEEASRALFTLFLAHVAAGFSEDQALRLLAYMMTASARTPEGGREP